MNIYDKISRIFGKDEPIECLYGPPPSFDNELIAQNVPSDRPLNQSYQVGPFLYAGEYPGDKNGQTATEKLEQMHAFSVRVFIDLTEEGELVPYENLLAKDTKYHRFPIPDVSVPTSIEKARKIVKFINHYADGSHGKVYVHCWGGVGRTGTIIACYLAEQMDNPEFKTVMTELRNRFAQMPKSTHRRTPETAEQERFIKLYIADVQKRHRLPRLVQDRIRGSLIGGAIGDALGYPVEFLSRKNILHKYGPNGITSFQDFNAQGVAVVSDDTQMTLFTANGLLFGVTRFCTHGGLGAELKDFVRYAYMDWYETQTGVKDYYAYHYCWIRDIKELNVRRAPGNTCMSALNAIMHHQEVQNDSKGCGGVMRVAPVGLMAAADELVLVKDWYGDDVPRMTWKKREIVRLGGDCAELTHRHPLGYLPAAFMADLIYYIMMFDGKITPPVLERFLRDIDADCRKEFTKPEESKALDELWALLEKAIRLAGDYRVADELAIPQLGEGWTGDEALAIAVYSARKYLLSFERALICAVNHDGDSDSTGAICGNIMGAIVGYENIPSKFTDKLELASLIVDMADDIYKGCPINEYHAAKTEEEKIWEQRYVKIAPTNETYSFMPKAKQILEYKRLEQNFHSASRYEQCRIAYQLALQVFDTDTFDPYHPLPYHRLCDEPRSYFDIKEYTPAYYYGYEDSKYSPNNNYRVFKLNHFCFDERNPIIAFRIDGDGHVENDLRAGLMKYYDQSLSNKYPGWQFYLIDRTTADGNYAVLTNQLEKDFTVEIAHLWTDGTLHCIYHLLY